MEKISGILRPNSRTRLTDTSTSQPVRPGAPSFGRPMGRVTVNDVDLPEERVNFSPEGRTKAEAGKIAIAQEVSGKFNLKKAKDEINDDQSLSEQMAESYGELESA